MNPNYDWNAFHKGNPIQRWWKRRIAKYVIEAAGNRNPIVDLGCGSSPVLSLLKGVEKLGIDMNPGKIDFMRMQDPTSEYRVGNIVKSNLPNRYFDTVLAIEVIEHLKDPFRLILEMARISKPGATIVIATPNFRSPIWKAVELGYKYLMPQGYYNDHVTAMPSSTIRSLARMCRLQHTATQTILGADLVMRFTRE